MSKRSPKKLGPDWDALQTEELKKWRRISIILITIGMLIIVKYVPTIKLGYKLAGALIFGVGVNWWLTARKYLNKS